ncbi:hypothetical protein RRG08_008729 [Elysia crispata]|uniref:Uncharacterized protein n=1 Tax=Elysia crispata TaxID=231223 RepID=A0AAE0XQ81_9GAST|nr:hypothetical protein RRG08_008729 [Elysia crispata]
MSNQQSAVPKTPNNFAILNIKSCLARNDETHSITATVCRDCRLLVTRPGALVATDAALTSRLEKHDWW